MKWPPLSLMPLVLAIESSCDETAVAILSGDRHQRTRILASEISSQIPLHQPHGGVVPELASRNHSLNLRPLIEQALRRAQVSIDQIDAFAATAGAHVPILLAHPLPLQQRGACGRGGGQGQAHGVGQPAAPRQEQHQGQG